jgi:hypothetical protein
MSNIQKIICARNESIDKHVTHKHVTHKHVTDKQVTYNLMSAVKNGIISTVQCILAYNLHDINKSYAGKYSIDQTMLCEAILSDKMNGLTKMDTIKFLLNNGADINLIYTDTDDDQYFALCATCVLHLQAKQDAICIFDILIDGGGNINQCTTDKMSALFMALFTHNFELVEILIVKYNAIVSYVCILYAICHCTEMVTYLVDKLKQTTDIITIRNNVRHEIIDSKLEDDECNIEELLKCVV